MFMTGTPQTLRRFPEMKLAMIVIGLMLLMLQTVLPLLPQKTASLDALFVLSVFGLNLPICFWCYYDSRERDLDLHHGFYLAAVLFGWLALIYYFFKSRGPKKGFLALAVTVGLFIAATSLTGLIAALLGTAMAQP